MTHVHFGNTSIDLDLVIFDKDGTLIDFVHAWGAKTEQWIESLLQMVHAAQALPLDDLAPLRAALFHAWGYDPVARRFAEQAPMVTASLATLQIIAATVLYQHGIGWLPAELLTKQAQLNASAEEVTPEMFRTLTDLPTLFGALQNAGVKVAVVTSDDEAPTRRTLEILQVAHLVDFVVGADSGYGEKPEPGGVLATCTALNVEPIRSAVVGDSTTDMLMGARAGVGCRVAVTSGLMSRDLLAPMADVVLDSIGEIHL